MSGRRPWALWLWLGWMVSTMACHQPPEPEAPAAARVAMQRQGRPEIADAMQRDAAAVRHASDGGGRAWIAEQPSVTQVGVPGAWSIVFEVGPLGVADGGFVFLQISPFWGWSAPQLDQPAAKGYTTVAVERATGDSSDDDSPALEAEVVDQHLVAVRVVGRALRPGERLRFEYGAGAGALPDRYVEVAAPFWLAVDGDGDGVRQRLTEPPEVAVQPGPPARLIATLPSTSRPGETVRLRLAVLDRSGNAGVDITGEFHLEVAPGGSGLGVELPPIRLARGERGLRTIELTPATAGVLRLRVVGPDGLETMTNPLQVAAGSLRVYWADLQNHSNLSDGTGQPAELYRYARDVAGLDVMSVTDHDHWGLRFLDRDPRGWEAVQAATEAFYRPGRFVTIRGYEWTSWIYGHRHVLVFDDVPLTIASSIDPATDHPQELWAALEGRAALTIAHHSAGGPIAIDWTIPPDPRFEPVTEIVSVHGSSEAADAPRPIHRPVAGNFVREAALGRGYRLGFIGSSDGHDGHPGLGQLVSGVSGLAAILSDAEPAVALTREAIYDALMARRTYATSGPRILLRAAYGGYRMGAEVPLRDGVAADGPHRSVEILAPDQLFVQVLAPTAVERVDVFRARRPSTTLDCQGRSECLASLTVQDLEAGDWLYVRAVQIDGHVALSSPFFFVGSEPIEATTAE